MGKFVTMNMCIRKPDGRVVCQEKGYVAYYDRYCVGPILLRLVYPDP